jgi:hypothetical protein
MSKRKTVTKHIGKRRSWPEILKASVPALALGVSVTGLVLTEVRETALDWERRLDRLSARLDEAARLVQAAPFPPRAAAGTNSGSSE